MRGVRSWLSGIVLIVGGVALPPQGMAQTQSAGDSSPKTVEEPKTLEERVDELDQQVRILQRLRELAAESLATAAKDRQSATANAKDGFSLKSAVGKYTLKIRGYAQAGVKASVPVWRADPTVTSELFNLTGLAHKIMVNLAERVRELDERVYG